MIEDDAFIESSFEMYSNWTLIFNDLDNEMHYTSSFANRKLHNWKVSTICGILILAICETVVQLQWFGPERAADPLVMALFLVLCVFVPLLAIVGLVLFQPTHWTNRHLQRLSLAYILVIGPVSVCLRYFLLAETFLYYDVAIAPYFMVIIFSFTFLLSLGFLHTMALSTIAVIIWTVTAALSYARSTQTIYSVPELSRFVVSTVSILIGAILLTCVAYVHERNDRLQFLRDKHYHITNEKLYSQLKGLESAFVSRIVDLESPLEKAILYAKMLLSSPSVTAEQIQIVNMILTCLNNPNLMAPDLYQQVRQGQVVIDTEQEKWLFNELAKKHRVSLMDTQSSQGEPSPVSVKPVTEMAESVETIGPDRLSRTPEIDKMLEQVKDFNFPIFDYAKLAQDNALGHLAYYLMVSSGLLDRLSLSTEKFVSFVMHIEKGYDASLSFHNSLHATDVIHAIHFLMRLERFENTFSDLDVLSMYTAAAIHDYDHPGVNNNFLIATQDPRAMLYNDKSVLENHHCASAFKVLIKPENNFLDKLDKKQYKAVRATIVDLVLATDLAQHFSLLTAFKTKIAGQFDPTNNQEDKNILMQMLIKAADVSNPTKQWPIYEEWIKRITQEFFSQGDKERELGLPISPFCNRDAPNASDPTSSQKGFIEFIVAPLYDALETYTPLGVIRTGLNQSKYRFCALVEEPKKKTRQRIGSLSLRLDNVDRQSLELHSASPLQSPLPQKSKRRSSLAAGFKSMSLFSPTLAQSIENEIPSVEGSEPETQ